MEAESLFKELANGKAVFTGLLAGITQSDAQVKPNAESRSILEVVCHLYDEEREDFRRRLELIFFHPQEPVDFKTIISSQIMKCRVRALRW